jgi:hypothetical protein
MDSVRDRQAGDELLLPQEGDNGDEDLWWDREGLLALLAQL